MIGVSLHLNPYRVGEAAGLRWDNIDWQRGEMHIRHTVQRLHGLGIVAGTPKTAKSRRTLDLAPATLRAHKFGQNEERLMATTWEERPEWQGLVFTTTRGGPLDSPRCNNAFTVDSRGPAGLRCAFTTCATLTPLCWSKPAWN